MYGRGGVKGRGVRVCVFDRRWQLVSLPLVSLFLLFPASLSPPAHAAPALAAHVPPLWKRACVIVNMCVLCTYETTLQHR